jgi:hypothetical protein
MPFSWRPRERTRLTCSTGGDVVADIGCRRDVLTCPIANVLPVLPLPPPALPSGSNGASPASTWPIPQTERLPQSIVLRFFRTPQQDRACARGRNGGNAPCLRGICLPHLFCCLLPLSPRHASSSTLISPSTQVARIIRQTGSSSAGQSTTLWSNDFLGVIGFPDPLVTFPALGGPFSCPLTIGALLG